MEKVEFSGYEPGAVMAQKMKILVEEIKALRAEIEKLKAGEPVKKATKAKVEE